MKDITTTTTTTTAIAIGILLTVHGSVGDNVSIQGPGGIISSVDLMAKMYPIGAEEDSTEPSFYAIGGSFVAPGDDFLPSRYFGLYKVKDARFDANCTSVDGSVNHCHLVVLNATSCSMSALEGASHYFLPGEDPLTYDMFAYTTTDDGSISNPFWGETELGIIEETDEGVVELFGARDFESNLDFSFKSRSALTDLQSFFNGRAVGVYGKENSLSYCGIFDTVSQVKSDLLEKAYFKRFEEACTSPGLSEEEFIYYDCKYVLSALNEPSSAPELALQFWLLVAIAASQSVIV